MSLFRNQTPQSTPMSAHIAELPSSWQAQHVSELPSSRVQSPSSSATSFYATAKKNQLELYRWWETQVSNLAISMQPVTLRPRLLACFSTDSQSADEMNKASSEHAERAVDAISYVNKDALETQGNSILKMKGDTVTASTVPSTSSSQSSSSSSVDHINDHTTFLEKTGILFMTRKSSSDLQTKPAHAHAFRSCLSLDALDVCLPKGAAGRRGRRGFGRERSHRGASEMGMDDLALM
jgi:hypothetical protein